MSLLTTLGDKECDGVKVSKKAMNRTLRGWEDAATALRTAVMCEVGREFDLDSKKDVTSVLVERGLLGGGADRLVTPSQLEELAYWHSLPTSRLASWPHPSNLLSAFCPCPGADRPQPAPRSSAEKACFIGVNWEEPVLLPPLDGLENRDGCAGAVLCSAA